MQGTTVSLRYGEWGLFPHQPECPPAETGESFHKIGITAQNLKTRFRSSRYSAETVATVETTLYEAWQWEALILNAFAKHKYTPFDEGFSGRTECFKLTPDVEGEIAEIIDTIT